MYYYLGSNVKIKKNLYKIGGWTYSIFIVLQLSSTAIFIYNRNTIQLITIIVLEVCALPAQIATCKSIPQILKHIDSKYALKQSKDAVQIVVMNNNDGSKETQ